MDLQEGFTGMNGFARNVDSDSISLILNKDSFGFICDSFYTCYVQNGSDGNELDGLESNLSGCNDILLG